MNYKQVSSANSLGTEFIAKDNLVLYIKNNSEPKVLPDDMQNGLLGFRSSYFGKQHVDDD